MSIWLFAIGPAYVLSLLRHRQLLSTLDFCMSFMKQLFLLKCPFLLAYVGMTFEKLALNFRQAIQL